MKRTHSLVKMPAERKRAPLATGLLDYFPAALAAVAECSLVANEQHNAGEPLHWAREKSRDHADCLLRHLAERGTVDDDGIRHSAKAAWRALAALQEEIEAETGFDALEPAKTVTEASKALPAFFYGFTVHEAS